MMAPTLRYTIDDGFGAFFVASALFWLLVIVLFDVVQSRNHRERPREEPLT